jgi:hypothetical protein
MVDGLYIHTQNRTMKPLAIALSGVRRGLRGRDGGDNLTNVEYKSIGNYQNEFALYNEYMPIKMKKESSIISLPILRMIGLFILVIEISAVDSQDFNLHFPSG